MPMRCCSVRLVTLASVYAKRMIGGMRIIASKGLAEMACALGHAPASDRFK